MNSPKGNPFPQISEIITEEKSKILQEAQVVGDKQQTCLGDSTGNDTYKPTIDVTLNNIKFQHRQES